MVLFSVAKFMFSYFNKKKKDEYVFTLKSFSASCFTFDGEGKLGVSSQESKLGWDLLQNQAPGLTINVFPLGCLCGYVTRTGWEARPLSCPHAVPIAFP